MEKISFLGLKASGKSCYIYAMSHAMMEGVKFADSTVLNVHCTTMAQMSRLHNEYMKMANGAWPDGTNESTTYNYSSRLRLRKVMDFQLHDYRGNLLDSCDEDEMEEHEELFKTFEDSCSLIFFIGADTVLGAMSGNFMDDYKIGNMGVIYGEYLDKTGKSETPILVVISKADMLPPDRVEEAKVYVKEKLQGIFGVGTGLTVAITTVTLGKNLINDDGDLQGQLIVKPTAGNIHIPILFSLYSVVAKRIEDATGRLNTAQSNIASGQAALGKERKRSAFARFFSSNESRISASIANASKAAAMEKSNLENCADTLAKIKGILVENTELYINGERQQ